MISGKNITKQFDDRVLFSKIDFKLSGNCLLYTSDAADDLLCVALGGRRHINKKNKLYIRPATSLASNP